MRGVRNGIRKPPNAKNGRVDTEKKNPPPNNVKTKDTTDKKVITKDLRNISDSIPYCDICAQLVPGPEREKIFAFGRCDHLVCYVCSTRLRVICDQTDCPICRDKLDKVIFSINKDTLYSKIDLSKCLYNEKYKIYFENESIKKAFDKLLKFECLECLKNSKKDINGASKTREQKSTSKYSPFRDSILTSPTGMQRKKDVNQQGSGEQQSQLRDRDVERSTKDSASSSQIFDSSPSSASGNNITEDSSGLLDDSDVPTGAQFPDVLSLKNHLNYVHKLRLCDLCLTHNKLFPHEYSYYDPNSLRKHMKEGELNTSHRGHPDCKLCHDTFFNMDELLLHMSREHFHCHICARQDTNLRYYFMDYVSLREHFRNSHFLCERGNCKVEQFTSAFENEIEYQFHVFNVHGNPSSSRGESRQQRTITLEPAPHRATIRGSSPQNNNHHRQTRQDPNVAIVTTGQMATANNSTTQRPPENILNQLRQQRLPSRNEFPALGRGPSNSFAVVPISTTSPSPSLITNSTQTVSGPTRAQIRQALREPMRSVPPTPSDINNFPTILPSSSQGSQSFVSRLGGGTKRPEQLNQSDFPPLPEQPKSKLNPSKKSKNQPKPRLAAKDMTLDELIRNSLVLGSSSSRSDNNRNKGHNSKNVKHKPLKIQLS